MKKLIVELTIANGYMKEVLGKNESNYNDDGKEVSLRRALSLMGTSQGAYSKKR
ncbi:MAG: hypothetical protein QXW72_07170 [Conexivisphaerales archaeon]